VDQTKAMATLKIPIRSCIIIMVKSIPVNNWVIFIYE
jgi:hypothetical protein